MPGKSTDARGLVTGSLEEVAANAAADDHHAER